MKQLRERRFERTRTDLRYALFPLFLGLVASSGCMPYSHSENAPRPLTVRTVEWTPRSGSAAAPAAPAPATPERRNLDTRRYDDLNRRY